MPIPEDEANMPDRPDTDPGKPGDMARPGTPGTGENVCPACRGEMVIDGKPCTTCNGTGIVIDAIGGG